MTSKQRHSAALHAMGTARLSVARRMQANGHTTMTARRRALTEAARTSGRLIRASTSTRTIETETTR